MAVQPCTAWIPIKKILIPKLEHYGIRGLALDLLQNYLEKQTQFVEVKKKSSNVLPINQSATRFSTLSMSVSDMHQWPKWCS